LVNDATLAPSFAIEIEGATVGSGLNRFINHVEYESADGLADVARVRCVNPDSVVSSAKAFQPGNEMSIYMGYGDDLSHIGRVVIIKQVPNFPQDGEPTLQVVGYTADTRMMDNAPEKSKKKKGKDGRAYKDMTTGDLVIDKAIAPPYGFKLDVDETPDGAFNCIQKVGLSDYEWINGLANEVGYVFWVDGDEKGVWTLHFKNPEGLKVQDKIYTFKYDFGDYSSLLSFTPELLISGAKTKLAVSIKDRETGRIIKVEVEEENDKSPDMSALGDMTSELTEEYTSASDIKLFFNDFSFETVANRRFQTEAEVVVWAQMWFRRMRENFVLSRGRTIGTEDLMARQTHNIEGVGSAYDGEYYFTKVKQIVDANQGYICDFNSRKVVP